MRENNIEIKFRIPYLQSKSESDQLIVSSHERSGTHFLMNSIDFAFNHYSSKKSINFDYQKLGSFINFHSPSVLENFFSNSVNGLPNVKSPVLTKAFNSFHNISIFLNCWCT